MSTYSNFSDNELYALMVQDNEEAFTFLYHRYWKRLLYKAAFKLQSDVDAEEVVQDVFVDLWKSRKRIEIQHSFHTYVAAILRYKIMAKMAANKKCLHKTVEDIYQLAVSDHSTEQWLAFSDLQEEIEAAVKALPDKCQLIFRMSREKGLSDKQIAQDLDLSPKTVEAHITRAIKFLRISINQFLTLLSLVIAFLILV
ncbi:RNA polymerase sigma-70 factor [Pedobacter punctiformis]|uniref:RNA polymerase sigma-70 factor n=1 Tax=Pedobacter punctiformis TaxID=3004097 RepID=A0ABT4L8D3_9SPHI|nr:RNA polymerase sigma-70 factor [Pedobacter sp. HCMS5-2]MCZ4244176.1 RNA polymerase sigma-70 factor [Pedobacter sp. HCMS5-2]